MPPSVLTHLRTGGTVNKWLESASSEYGAVQKKGKERGGLWFSGLILIVVVIVGSLVTWLLTRESNTISLKYGEFIQVLNSAKQTPAVGVQNVEVGRSDIRGQIVT